jgi:hypothetical protein
MQRKSGAPGVVATTGIDEQYIGPLGQSDDGALKQWPLPQREELGPIVGAGRSTDRDVLAGARHPRSGGRRPPPLACESRTSAIACEAHKTSAEEQIVASAERLRVGGRQFVLHTLEFPAGARPLHRATRPAERLGD